MNEDVLQGLVLGGAIGFILGYLTNHVRRIERGIAEVKSGIGSFDECVEGCKEQHIHNYPPRDRNEEGAFRWSWSGVGLVLVVLLTAFSAFSASQLNNKLENVVGCLVIFNTNQNTALAARDEAIKQETADEIELWTLYEKLFKEGNKPGTSEKRISEIQTEFYEAVTDYRDQLIETQAARDMYSYEDPNVLAKCKEKSEND